MPSSSDRDGQGARRPGWIRGTGDTADSSYTHDAESGSATVEFLGLALVLMIPLIYLMVFVSQVQAAALGAVAAAEQAAQATAAIDAARGARSAVAGAHLTLGDYGFDARAVTVDLACSDGGCGSLEPEEIVRSRVEVSVPLPLIHTLTGTDASPVTISAEAQQRVPRH